MIHKLARWIPCHVSGKVIVVFYWIMNIFNFVSGSTRRKHLEHNSKCLREIMDLGFVNNQKCWNNVKFGAVDMAYAGCEIIAAYNVLLAMEKGQGPEFMSELISDFEKNGAILGARAGTSPLAIKKQLDKRGVKSRVLWDADQASENARLFIATIINNRQDLYDQIHTLAIARQEEGYVVYNAGKPIAEDSLLGAINQSAKDPVVVCILEITNEH